MPRSIGPTELIIILVIVVLLFGGKKLPELTKSVAESLRVFKKEVKKDDTKKDEASTTAEGDKPEQK
jgi:sec-independent protein translocase protein TatA